MTPYLDHLDKMVQIRNHNKDSYADLAVITSNVHQIFCLNFVFFFIYSIVIAIYNS